MNNIDAVFHIGVAIILAVMIGAIGGVVMQNDNKNAQAICELQRSADSCFQILNR